MVCLDLDGCIRNNGSSMTVVSRRTLAVKDCQLVMEPSVLLTHIREDVWSAAIELQTYRKAYRLRFSFRATWSGNGRWGRVPATHEVVHAFMEFRQRLLERELVPLLETCAEPVSAPSGEDGEPDGRPTIRQRVTYLTPAQAAQAA